MKPIRSHYLLACILFSNIAMASNTSSTPANDFAMDCSFSEGETLTALSSEATFAESFSNTYMPVTGLIEGDMPALYFVDAKESNASQDNEMTLFLSAWFSKEKLSREGKELVSLFVSDVENVAWVRIAFPTDLLKSLTYAEIVVNLPDVGQETIKVAVAGLSNGLCQ